MPTQVEWEQLVLQHHLIEGHDVETDTHLAACVEVFARVIQESYALKYVIIAQVLDLVLCLDRLLQFQSCLWAALLARGNISKQFNRYRYLNELERLRCKDGAVNRLRGGNGHSHWARCILVSCFLRWIMGLCPREIELEWMLQNEGGMERPSHFLDLDEVVEH